MRDETTATMLLITNKVESPTVELESPIVGDLSISTLIDEWRRALPENCLLALRALRLLRLLDRELEEARAQWNQDWFRRVMRVRARAIARLQRRWERVFPGAPLEAKDLRRRYHANVGLYLYKPAE